MKDLSNRGVISVVRHDGQTLDDGYENPVDNYPRATDEAYGELFGRVPRVSLDTFKKSSCGAQPDHASSSVIALVNMPLHINLESVRRSFDSPGNSVETPDNRAVSRPLGSDFALVQPRAFEP